MRSRQLLYALLLATGAAAVAILMFNRDLLGVAIAATVGAVLGFLIGAIGGR